MRGCSRKCAFHDTRHEEVTDGHGGREDQELEGLMKRLSRRKAIAALLGSGAVAGVVLTPDEADAQAWGQNAVAGLVKVTKVTVAGSTIQGNVLKSIAR